MSTNKIVLFDDNFTYRKVISSLVNFIARKSKKEIEFYSSDNGVEGLGLVYVLKPTIVIIDTTLPKYSGKEVVDFIEDNEQLQASNIKVIALTQGTEFQIANPHIKVINKQDSDFIEQLIAQLVVNLDLNLSLSKQDKIHINLSEFICNNANHADIIKSKLSGRLGKVVNTLLWAGLELINSFFILLLFLILGAPKEDNIQQKNLDKKQYRVRYYPTLISVFTGLIVTGIQFSLFISAGVAILNTNIESFLASVEPEVSVDLGRSSYDPELIELNDTVLQLRNLAIVEEPVPTPTIVLEEPTIAPTETPVPTLVAPTPTVEVTSTTIPTPSVTPEPEEVLGADTQTIFTTETQVVEFDEEIEYSALLYIHEIGSNNDADTSNNDIEFGYTAESFPSNGITYQLSPNKGIDWYYYNGDNWQATDGEWQTSNTIQEINLNLAKYNELESSSLMLRAYFHSDGNTLVSLRELIVGREVSLVQEEVVTPDIEAEPDVVATERFLDEYKPIILNASWFEGNKIIAGRVELPTGIAIEESELEKFKVHIYYSNADSATKNEMIGSSDVVMISGEIGTEYVFELQTPSHPGGYITAELEYVDGEFIHNSPLAEPVENSTFTVTQTGDQTDPSLNGNCDVDLGTPGSQCTLRAAIQEANRLTDTDNIHFNIPGAGVHTIQPTSSYPLIEYNVNIDGTTQPGASCGNLLAGEGHNLLINVRGGGFSGRVFLTGGNSNIQNYKGLIINNTLGAAVHIYSSNYSTAHITFQCNYIGVDSTGTVAVPNTKGIDAPSTLPAITIGGSNIGEGNLISGNTGRGIDLVWAKDVEVYGNLIGTDYTGNQALPNADVGLYIHSANQSSTALNLGGLGPYQRNVISGNSNFGVYIGIAGDPVGTYNIINNYFGVGLDGTTNVQNGFRGIHIQHNINFSSDINIENNIFANQTYNLSLTTVKGIEVKNNEFYGGSYGVYMSNGVKDGKFTNNYFHDIPGAFFIQENNSGNQIGDQDPTYGNILRDMNNGIYMMDIYGNFNNAIIGNSINTNSLYGGKGIRLGNYIGETNDYQDVDNGPNGGQNYPELENAYNIDPFIVRGKFNSEPNSTYHLEFFTNQTPNSTGYGDGLTYLTSYDLTTDTNGDFDIYTSGLSLGTLNLPAGEEYLTATATKCLSYDPGPVCTSFGATSQFSNAIPITIPSSITDIAVHINISKSAADIDEVFDINVSYENRANEFAQTPVLTITLPIEISEPSQIIANNSNKGVEVNCEYDNIEHEVVCTFADDLEIDDYGTISITTLINNNAANGDLVSIPVELLTNSFDNDFSNNFDIDNIRVGSGPDMVSYITSNRSSAQIGDQISYKAKFVNNGNLTANVVIGNFKLASNIDSVNVIYPNNTNKNNSLDCLQNSNSKFYQCAKSITSGIVPIDTQRLYALPGWGDSDELWVLNPDDLSILEQHQVTLNGDAPYAMKSLTYNKNNNTLYALIGVNGSWRDPWKLVTINPSTGEATLIGTASERMASIAITDNGTIYATTGPSSNNAHPNALFTIDPSTGQETYLVDLPSSNSGSILAYDFDTDRLVRAYSYERNVDIINPTTLTVESTFSFDDPYNTTDPVSGMVYEGNGRFLVSFWEDEFARLDYDGNYTEIYRYYNYNLAGIAFPRNVTGYSQSGDFLSGESMILEITGSVSNGVSPNDVLTSQAISTTSSSENNTTNNIATHNLLIGSNVNVYLDPIETSGAFSNKELTYNIVFGNNGDTPSQNTYIEILHSDILSFKSAEIINGTNSVACDGKATYTICTFSNNVNPFSKDTLRIKFTGETLKDGDIVNLPTEIFTSSNDYNQDDNYLEYILGITIADTPSGGGNNIGRIELSVPTPTPVPDTVAPNRDGTERPGYEDRETIVSLPDTGSVVETDNSNLILAIVIPALAAAGTLIFAYPGIIIYLYYFILGFFKDNRITGKVYDIRDYERVAFVVVKLYNNDKLVDITASNLDGQYKLKKVKSTKIIFTHPEYETYTDLVNVKDKDSLMTRMHKTTSTKITNLYRLREYVRANLGLINNIWLLIGVIMSLMTAVYLYRSFHLVWVLIYIMMLVLINIPKKTRKLIISS